MSQRRLTYVSRVAPGIADTDIRLILGAAEVIHRRLDLSGVLGYTGAHFVQIIEGNERDVDALMALVRADQRHADIRVLCDQPIRHRDFDRWFSTEIASLDMIDLVEALVSEGSGNCSDAELLRRHLQDELSPDSRF